MAGTKADGINKQSITVQGKGEQHLQQAYEEGNVRTASFIDGRLEPGIK